jgi:hypothetical protein
MSKAKVGMNGFIEKYNGWNLYKAYYCFVAIHPVYHDESGKWQIHANSLDELKELVDDWA